MKQFSNLAISDLFFWNRLPKPKRRKLFVVVGIAYVKTARSTEAAWPALSELVLSNVEGVEGPDDKLGLV